MFGLRREVFDGVLKGVEEPAGEFWGVHEVRPPEEEDEDGLGGVFSELSIAELAVGGGEDPGAVAVDEGAE